jgi:hypothetical protein
MLHAALRRLGLRGRPTRSRSAPTRLSGRPRLELLEDRVVPSGSAVTIRAPYTPYATPQIVASLPQQNTDHSQSLTYAIANNARGDSITASVNLPEPHDQVLPGDGLFYTFMDRFGVASAPVSLVGLDYNPSDGTTSDLTGDVAVAVSPNPPYGPVAPYSPFAIAYVQDQAHYSNPTAPPDWATDTLYVRAFDAYGNPLPGGPVPVAQVDLKALPSGTHTFIHDVKIGADGNGGYTVAWLTDTQVDANGPTHGSRTIGLYAAKAGVLPPPTLVAQSSVDTGLYNSPSDYRGDMIVTPDLATDSYPQPPDLDPDTHAESVVVWARLTNPAVYYYSGYLQLDHIYGQRLDDEAGLYGPQLQISQNADRYASSAMPSVAIQDVPGPTPPFVVSWTYVPPPFVRSGASPGDYARLYKADGTAGNEFMVVSNPNIAGEGPNWSPSPAQYRLVYGTKAVMDAAGNFDVEWSDETTDSTNVPYRMMLQAYTGTGQKYKDAFSLVTSQSQFQNSVEPLFDLAMDADGSLVAAWVNPNDVPGSWRTVLAQRFVRADFVVQNGEAQRDHVQSLDITFNPDDVDLAALAAGGRLRLTQYDLTGTTVIGQVPLDGVVSVVGNTLHFDFSSLAGAGLPGDGYYVLQANLNGDGTSWSSWAFYQMSGDMTGTGLNDYLNSLDSFMGTVILNG